LEVISAVVGRGNIEMDLNEIGARIQNYWVFGLFPSSSILKTRKHDVSEEDTYSVGSLRKS
jgi:hypothetical protein